MMSTITRYLDLVGQQLTSAPMWIQVIAVLGGTGPSTLRGPAPTDSSMAKNSSDAPQFTGAARSAKVLHSETAQPGFGQAVRGS